MTDLLTRLSKLDAPDREVDAEICIALQYVTAKGATDIRRDTDEEFKDEWLDFEVDGELWSEKTPELTASVDAVIALTERELPGHGWFVRNDTDGNHAGIFIPMSLHVIQGRGATPAIALCIALLRAKEASK